MNQKIKNTLQQLDKELDIWANQLSAYSHEQLNQQAADGGWSAMQCMHHLILSEQGTMAYIKKKLSFNPELPNKGISDHWRRFLLIGYLKSPIKFKAPKGIGTEYLPTESNLEQTLKQWRTLRAQMRKDLDNIDPQYFNKSVFKHPLAGRISLDTTMAFLQAHFQRHRKQAMRVVEK